MTRLIDATLYDRLRRKRKIETDPWARLKAHVHSSATPIPEPQLPHLNLVTDPMLEWGRALEKFDTGQVAEKPANEQVTAPAPQSAGMKPFDQQRLVEPYNNPFSTLPGGMGFGPMKPPGR